MSHVIHHPQVEADRRAVAKLREMVGKAPAPAMGPEGRPGFDHQLATKLAAPGVTYETAKVGGVPGVWCRPPNAQRGSVILYLHGGGYVMGSATAARNYVGQIAVRANAATFVADYRLAPEYPYPAAVDDALAVYSGLAELSRSIVIAGDSAGGGLALVTLALVNKANRPAKGCVVLSPWTDLALTSPSLQTRAAEDPILVPGQLAAAAKMYLGKHDSRDARVSPVYGDLSALPPVQLHVGDAEIMLDDAVRYAEKSANAVVHVWEGMPHVFPASVGTYEAAGVALEIVGAFMRERLHAAV
ncbi:alpha/beta hydrolase [soil metagenome]